MAEHDPFDLSKFDPPAEEHENDRLAYIEVLAVVEELAQRHQAVLVTKRRQKTYVDDYGLRVDDGWDAEVHYFVENVVKKELLAHEYDAQMAGALAYAFHEASIEARLSADVAQHLDDRLSAHIAMMIEGLGEGTPETGASERELTPDEYEHHCADLLRAAGWQVRVCGGAGDQGVDLIADRDGLRVVFQCKKYSRPVGNSAVQEVHTGLSFHDAHLAVVVSNADFTPGARTAAQQAGVMLLHHSQLPDFRED